MRKHVWSIYLILILTPVLISAADRTPREEQSPLLVDGQAEVMLMSGFAGSDLTISSRDTIYLLGGPDRLDGKFENAEGYPAWHGWTSVDLTAVPDTQWHIDTYNCAELDPGTPDNHAWWCGLMYPECPVQDQPGGYGNRWLASLSWSGTVPDPDSEVTVRVTAMLNHDTEPNYDYLYFQYENTIEWQTLVSIDGDNRNMQGEFVPVVFDTFVTLAPEDYRGDTQDQVHLRWQFESDGTYSDEDCLHPSVGAAQIDQITVTFDQGEGEFPVGVTETCEPGDPVQWVPYALGGSGAFGHVWPLLQDIDPCHDNDTPQAAFIDNGIVVPGTGGTLCTTWCYGPNGYIVNPTGGLRGPDYRINCEIWSPILAWPGGDYGGASFEFDKYLHETLGAQSAGILQYWLIRSTDNPDPDDESSWTDWQWNGSYYFGKPSYERVFVNALSWTVPCCTYVQVALGVYDHSAIDGIDGTPAPYFDNVVFKVFPFNGPSIHLNPASGLAQDNFPEIGTIDYEDLGVNHVRFDHTWYNVPAGRAGDSLLVNVTPARCGAVLVESPRMYYKLEPNPLFDPYRTSGLPSAGFVYGDSVRNVQGDIIEGRFSFDLPDTGFFYPGDVAHYYFEGKDEIDGVVGTTRVPADTSGFGLFPGDQGFVPTLYPTHFTFHALPSLASASEGDQPPILFWNDRYYMSAWGTALANLGYREGVDYDLFFSQGAYSNNPNGLGTRATATLLRNYQTLLYSSGPTARYTMTEWYGSDLNVDMLDTWLRYGNRNMFLTGDSYIFDMTNNGTASTLNFVSNWIPVNLVQINVQPLIDNQVTSLIKTVPGNPVFNAVAEWIANSGCPVINDFDAVLTSGNAVRIAEFTDPNAQSGAYPYAAAVYHHEATYGNDVIYLPYDFDYIMTPQGGTGSRTEAPLAARTQLLNEVLLFFGHIGSSPITEVPDLEPFSVTSYPNPFNPSTRISFHMPRRGELAIKVYNIRGELVKVLIDEVRSAGSDFVVWDGSDNRGRSVASGVYFYQARALGETLVRKVSLIK